MKHKIQASDYFWEGGKGRTVAHGNFPIKYNMQAAEKRIFVKNKDNKLHLHQYSHLKRSEKIDTLNSYGKLPHSILYFFYSSKLLQCTSITSVI